MICFLFFCFSVLCLRSHDKNWPQLECKYASLLIFFLILLSFIITLCKDKYVWLRAPYKFWIMRKVFGVQEYLNSQLRSFCFNFSKYAPFIKSKTKILTHTVRESSKHSPVISRVLLHQMSKQKLIIIQSMTSTFKRNSITNLKVLPILLRLLCLQFLLRFQLKL